ncbi:MAG: hypothetical protein KBD37_03060 [Burkholderiales bacterium]|nr:hypothetical protein [Burkholderiales bacterium]
MQAALILAIMSLATLFMAAQLDRHDSANLAHYHVFKAAAVASNIEQYNDLIVQYALTNYDTLHLTMAVEPGMVEHITTLDYIEDEIGNYSQKKLLPFLKYTVTVFNYAKNATGESEATPLLYLATSWDSYAPEVINSYVGITLPEIMGQLGQDLSQHIYQGNSTYWVVPWVFSQNNCEVDEIFSQLPDNAYGIANTDKLKDIFKLFCTQIQANSSYIFLKYVYLQPVIKSSVI